MKLTNELLKLLEATTGRIRVLLRIAKGKPNQDAVDKNIQKFSKEFKTVTDWSTEKAVHIDWDGPQGFWLPKSQIKWKGEISGDVDIKSKPSIIYVPEWLAKNITQLRME